MAVTDIPIIAYKIDVEPADGDWEANSFYYLPVEDGDDEYIRAWLTDADGEPKLIFDKELVDTLVANLETTVNGQITNVTEDIADLFAAITGINSTLAGHNTRITTLENRPDTGLTTAIVSQIFSMPGSATWTKPQGAKLVYVRMVGAGGGGGSGCFNSLTSVLRGGGGGGAGGAFAEGWFDASDLPSSVALTVGTGGTGGIARTVDNAGANGGAGTASHFGAFTSGNTSYLYAGGGNGGAGGSTSGGGNGGSPFTFLGTATEVHATSGAVGAGASAATAPASPSRAGGAGGGGGGITTANAATNPSAGSNGAASSSGGYANSGPTNANGQLFTGRMIGGGGGGGAASISASANGGGNGAVGGGGGGGGAASITSSGKGGDGGRGEIRIISYL